jgi:hypothetical protein
MKIEEVFAEKEIEFFYKEDDSVVVEGEHIGYDVDVGKEVRLVLNDNIYWNPDASVE